MTEDFERAWTHLEPSVQWARQHTKDSVFAEIKSGKARLWLMPNSAAVTILRKYPCGRKSFGIWLGGGELDEIVDWVKGPATQAALAGKCDEMRVISGRRGWIRALNWRDAGAVAVLDLDHA